MLTNVPRISDVEVMARLLLDLGAEVEGIGSTTLRVRCPEIDEGRAGRRAGRPAARVGAAARAAAGAARARAPGAAGRRLSGAPDDRHAPRSARWRWARASVDGPGHVLEAPDGLKPTSIYLYEASVTGTETALLAAAAAPGVTEIRHAACEPHVVELCEFLRQAGRRHHRRGHADDPRRRRRDAARRRASAVGRLHRGRQLGGRRGGHRRRDRGPRRARRGHGSRRRGAEAAEHRVRDGRRRVPRRAVAAAGGRPHHDRPVAGISERPRQPRHRAGDAGGRPDAGARLAVRAAAVRARAVERHERAICSCAIRTASSSPVRGGCAAGRSTAATSGRGWR